MPYVERTNAGVVKGLFARPQPGMAKEFLEADNQEVLDFNLRMNAVPPNVTIDLIKALVGTPQQRADAKLRLKARLS